MKPYAWARGLILLGLLTILAACGATRAPYTILPNMAPRPGSLTPYALKEISVRSPNGLGAQTAIERLLPVELEKQLIASNVFGSDLKNGYSLKVTLKDPDDGSLLLKLIPLSELAGQSFKITGEFELFDAQNTLVHRKSIRSTATSSRFSGRERGRELTNGISVDLAQRYAESVTAAMAARRVPASGRSAQAAGPRPSVGTATGANPRSHSVSNAVSVSTAGAPAARTSLQQSPRLESVAAKGQLRTSFGAYHALIIGNNSYRNLPQLESAIADANRVAETLKTRYGFSTQVLLDAERADILGALYKLRRNLTDNDSLLIYYAGHGWLDEQTNEGYWLPVNAEQQSTTDWISNASLTSAIRAMDAKHVLIVADSCFSGRLTRDTLTDLRTPSHIQRMAGLRARTALTSGGLEPVLDGGGEGGHSVFATAFLDTLEKNQEVIDMSALFSRIRRAVSLEADQIPEYGDIRLAGHKGGDFVFVPVSAR